MCNSKSRTFTISRWWLQVGSRWATCSTYEGNSPSYLFDLRGKQSELRGEAVEDQG